MRELLGILTRLFEEARERRFADFAGATVDVSLPLREGLVNDLLAAQMAAQEDAPVRQVRIFFPRPGRISVDIVPWQIFLPRLRIELDAPDTVDLTQDPTVRLRFAPESRTAAVLLEGASFLRRLPEGVIVANRQIVLHLPTLLERQNLGEFAPLLRFLMISGKPGILVLNMHFAVLPASYIEIP